jgi:epoxyqueuosine reductase
MVRQIQMKTNTSLKESLQRKSQEIGFEAIGFCSPFLTEEALYAQRQMVANEGYHDMAYLARHLAFKENPNLLLPGVQTAIVVIKNYKNTPQQHLQNTKKVARYAVGQDYHIVLQQKLEDLEATLKERHPEAACYIGVDSRPIAERALAIQSGIGFKGRNSMIIRPRLGSYFFIAVLLTTIKIPFDTVGKGTCGTCQRCVTACPTQTITPDGGFHIDRCIAYNTIEKKTPLTEEAKENYDGWTFGCDICQEVCPFNNPFIAETDWAEFRSESGVGFDFFDTVNDQDAPLAIPKDSALYRSRKRLFSQD